MADQGEEWAEEAPSFFAEFAASSSSGGASQRKRNREAAMQSSQPPVKTAESEAARLTSAAEARKRIAAAVLSRASPKEIQKAVRTVKKERGDEARDGKSGSSGAEKKKDRAGGLESSEEPRSGTMSHKKARVEEKFARKEQRKEEARITAIKNRKVLRKQRR